MAYFGYDARQSNDPLLQACAKDLRDPNLLNYFKPMNSSRNNLDYDYYSESEWRILYSRQLLEQKKIIDPRNPENSRAHEFHQGLDENSKAKLRYLMPLDGWFALIIYPSFWVKNIVKQNTPSKVVEEIQRIKSAKDHGNSVEGGNWPMEIDLPACGHF